MSEINVIDSNKVFDTVLEALANPLDSKGPIFCKMIKNGYDKVCIIITCLYHKDKWKLVGEDTRVVTGFKKGKVEVIPEDMSVEFKIYDDFFIKKDCETKDISSYRSMLIKTEQLPDDKNRKRNKEEKDIMFKGFRIYFKPYDSNLEG